MAFHQLIKALVRALGMWGNIKAVFTGLLAIIILAMGGAGCSGQVSGQVPSEAESPFITDSVATIRIVMKEADWNTCQKNPMAEQYVPADFWFEGELVPDVAVRPKGNSSLRQAASSRSPRFSLKVDFNLFNRARNFHGLKKVNLNNGWSDPTLIRERLAYELFEQIGIPTPRTSHVDLWINDTHLGVYTMVEQIDKTFLGRHFADATGNLYKPAVMAAALDWTEADLEEQRARRGIIEPQDTSQDINLGGGRLGDIMRALGQQELTAGNVPTPPPQGMPPPPGVASRQPRDYLEAMALKTNENNPDHSALLHFLNVLNNEPDATFPAEIEEVLDVDSVLRFLAVSALIVHLDNYIGLGHNYYLYEINGKFTILPWDLNMAFGTFNYGIDRQGLINFYIDEPTGGPVAERPLVKRLLSHQPYLDAYHGYLKSLLDGPFFVDVMESRIDQLADLIRPFVENDKLKFSSTRDFERGLTEDIGRAGAGQGIEPTPPPLSPESLSCLQKQFDRATLEKLRTRWPTASELAKLRSCLGQEELTAFLQTIQGPPPQFQQPRSGPTAIGLKTFMVERSESVRQQLEGERKASSGDGSGNGGSFRQPRNLPQQPGR